jgi:TIR domain
VEGAANSLFISYARADGPKVDPLVASLQRHGISIWIDKQGIPPGQAWAASIVKGLRSARFFMVFCSNASMRSQNVENEVYLANQQRKPIVAAILEPIDFPDSLALFLAKAQHFDTREGNTRRFLQDVRTLISSRA